MLLALSSALRTSSIQHLNMTYMAKAKSCYNFYFNKLHKSWRKGKTPSVVTYQEYTQDESPWVVTTCRTLFCPNRDVKIWRRALPNFVKFYPTSQTSGFFYKIWMLKSILMKSGVDTGVFKAHSTRSASTSKAGLKRTSIEGILKRRCWPNKSWKYQAKIS